MNLKKLHFLFCILFLFSSSQAYAECTNWEKIFAAPKGRSIAVNTFQLQTQDANDTWLAQGVRFFLSDLFKSVDGLNVLRSAESANYVLDGTVQRIEHNVRFFLSFSKSGEVLKRYELSVPLPLQRTFFLQLAELARKIMQDQQFTPNDETFKALRDSATSVQAYQAYTRGRELLLSFDSSKFSEAARWFEESKRADFRSPLGFAGSFETALMQAFAAKQAQQSFRSAFEAAEREIQLMKQYHIKVHDALLLLPKNSLQRDEYGDLHNRFLQAQSAFVEALAHSQHGDWRNAKTSLQAVLNAVPEDGITWYHLGKAESNLHEQKSAEKNFAEARKWNNCLP